jgi:hypothetical protein
MKHFFKDIKSLPSDKMPETVHKILYAATTQLKSKALDDQIKWLIDKKKYGKVTLFDEKFRPVAGFNFNSGIFKQGFIAKWLEEETENGKRHVYMECTLLNDNVIFSNNVEKYNKPLEKGEEDAR